MSLTSPQVDAMLEAYDALDCAINGMRTALPAQMTERETALHAKQVFFRALFHQLMRNALTPPPKVKDERHWSEELPEEDR